MSRAYGAGLVQGRARQLGVAGLVSLLAALVALAQAPRSLYDPVDYGAKGDGRTNDGQAIQRAIDACALAGGGTVRLPTGDFLTGTLVLKSKVTLHLSAGATLRASRQLADYGPLHLIYAEHAENVSLEGEGTIDGSGEAFWDAKFKAKEKRPSPLIELVGCRSVHLRDLRIRNLPGWGIHPWECDGVFIRGLWMLTDLRGPNTDGIDPDCSRNVFISDCYIEGGDDAICLKTTRRSAAPAPPCEHVVVNNCVLVSDDSALKLGTASYGDFRDCTFANCVITGTRYGIAMYIKDGAMVEGIRFANITIDTSVAYYNQRTGSTRQWIEYPIFVDLEKRTEASALGCIRDVAFSDINIRTKGRVLACGSPERPLENLSFRNLALRVTGFEPVGTQHKPRGVAKIRPAPRQEDYSTVPAALVFANARGVDLRDIRVTWDTPAPPQSRHALYAGQVDGLSLNGFVGGAVGSGLAAIGLENTKKVFVSGAQPDPGTAVFLGLSGVAQDQVVLTGNALGKATQATATGVSYIHLSPPVGK